MALITPKPLFLTDYTLKIGADNFEKAINSVLITPEVQVMEFKGGTPDSKYRKTVVVGCTAAIGYVQDWESAVSLSRYLQTNGGTDAACEFVPTKGIGTTIKTTLTLQPGPIGGTADSPAAGTVTLGGTVPVITYPAP